MAIHSKILSPISIPSRSVTPIAASVYKISSGSPDPDPDSPLRAPTSYQLPLPPARHTPLGNTCVPLHTSGTISGCTPRASIPSAAEIELGNLCTACTELESENAELKVCVETWK